jgi:hypothetical protein
MALLTGAVSLSTHYPLHPPPLPGMQILPSSNTSDLVILVHSLSGPPPLASSEMIQSLIAAKKRRGFQMATVEVRAEEGGGRWLAVPFTDAAEAFPSRCVIHRGGIEGSFGVC